MPHSGPIVALHDSDSLDYPAGKAEEAGRESHPFKNQVTNTRCWIVVVDELAADQSSPRAWRWNKVILSSPTCSRSSGLAMP